MEARVIVGFLLMLLVGVLAWLVTEVRGMRARLTNLEIHRGGYPPIPGPWPPAPPAPPPPDVPTIRQVSGLLRNPEGATLKEQMDHLRGVEGK
jgi:hypothetical protein